MSKNIGSIRRSLAPDEFGITWSMPSDVPLERQAGVEGMDLRKAHPGFCLIGHYDKMVMNKGEARMRSEFERLLPLMKSGGYIPSVDHQTPPHITLEEYRTYLNLLDEYTASVAE